MAVAAAPMPPKPRAAPALAAAPPAWVATVEAAARGDAAAFRRLHREFGPMVHGLLLARVDPATADDLTQEVFLSAWRRLERLHEPRAWPAYLATIARNRALDHVRRDRRPKTLPPDAELAPRSLAQAQPASSSPTRTMRSSRSCRRTANCANSSSSVFERGTVRLSPVTVSP
jgi:RNA polymerase sigma factor (sigma-70 family)